MEIRYRLHRVIVLQSSDRDTLLSLQIVDRDARRWAPIAIDTTDDLDGRYRNAFVRGLKIVDDACAARLAFPIDETQPDY